MYCIIASKRSSRLYIGTQFWNFYVLIPDTELNYKITKLNHFKHLSYDEHKIIFKNEDGKQ